MVTCIIKKPFYTRLCSLVCVFVSCFSRVLARDYRRWKKVLVCFANTMISYSWCSDGIHDMCLAAFTQEMWKRCHHGFLHPVIQILFLIHNSIYAPTDASLIPLINKQVCCWQQMNFSKMFMIPSCSPKCQSLVFLQSPHPHPPTNRAFKAIAGECSEITKSP